jgi:two-component system chemotaxis response regulator CheY
MPPRTVLVVDDDEDFRTLIRMHLERGGYQVVGEAANGAAGVAEAFRLNPDVLTLDVQMPYLTGEDALGHIREIRPNTKVVVISATVTEPPEWADVFLHKSELSGLPRLLDEMLA